MKRIIVSTLILLFFSAPVAASPKKQVWRDASGYAHTYVSLGHLAMEEVRWSWRPKGWSIDFYPATEGFVGVTDEDAKRISVEIRPEYSPQQVAATVVHELAHAFDILHLNDELRAEWLALRKLPRDTPWFACNDCSDSKTGAGDFAESVSWTFQGSEAGFVSKLGPPPDQEQQAFICKLLEKQ